MRKQFSALTQSCLTRFTTMIDVAERDGEPFDSLGGDRIFTPQQVAYILDTSTTTVASLVKRGRLVATNFGKVVRFLESDVMQFIGATHETV